jgi:hypothetical protein
MNLSDFPGFPGFLGIASSHPDKVRVQKETVEVVELNITDQIESMIKNLKYIETPECRAIMSKESIDDKRKKYTLIFKTLLIAKETQNTK